MWIDPTNGRRAGRISSIVRTLATNQSPADAHLFRCFAFAYLFRIAARLLGIALSVPS